MRTFLVEVSAPIGDPLTFDAPSTIHLHDAAAVRFSDGATSVLSGICGVADGHGFEVDIRPYGSQGSLFLAIEAERLVRNLHGGEAVTKTVPSGSWACSRDGPPNRLVDIAFGKGDNESPGHVGARAVESLHALLASRKA